MELFSKAFESKVDSIFNVANGPPILATIPISRPGSRPLALVEKLRCRKDSKLIHVRLLIYLFFYAYK
jgi:NTPase